MKKGILRRLSAAGLAVVTLLGMATLTVAATGENYTTNDSGEVKVCLQELNAEADGSVKATGTITVTGIGKDAANNYDTVEAYKIVNITYNKNTNDVNYTWANDAVEAAVDSVEGIDKSTGATKLTVKDFVDVYNEKTDNSAKKELAEKVYSQILLKINESIVSEDSTISSQFPKINPDAGAGETAVFSDLAMGQYIIKATGNNVYAAMTGTLQPVQGKADHTGENPDYYYLHNITIEAKTSALGVDKNIKNGSSLVKEDTVGINDTVTYQLDVTAPEYPKAAANKTFELEDKMEKGIIGVNGLVITSGEGENVKSLTAATDDISTGDYKVTYYSDGNCVTVTNTVGQAKSFKIEFNMNSSKVNGQKLTVKYDSKVTADIVGETGVKNKATLIWPKNVWAVKGNSDQPDDPTDNYNRVPSSVDVYSFGLDLTKVEKGTESAANPTKLKGAEFKLYKKDATEAISVVKTANGIYRVATDKDPANSKTTVLVVSDDPANLGGLKVSGLDVGEYKLEETKAPTGYSLPTDRFTLNIQAATTGDAGNGTLTGNVVDSTDAYLHSKIANSKGFTLPKTGDAAMFIMSIVGAGLVVFGVAFFALSRGKSRKQSRR